jgi:hypothetical protein
LSSKNGAPRAYSKIGEIWRQASQREHQDHHHVTCGDDPTEITAHDRTMARCDDRRGQGERESDGGARSKTVHPPTLGAGDDRDERSVVVAGPPSADAPIEMKRAYGEQYGNQS